MTISGKRPTVKNLNAIAEMIRREMSGGSHAVHKKERRERLHRVQKIRKAARPGRNDNRGKD